MLGWVVTGAHTTNEVSTIDYGFPSSLYSVVARRPLHVGYAGTCQLYWQSNAGLVCHTNVRMSAPIHVHFQHAWSVGDINIWHGRGSQVSHCTLASLLIHKCSVILSSSAASLLGIFLSSSLCLCLDSV